MPRGGKRTTRKITDRLPTSPRLLARCHFVMTDPHDGHTVALLGTSAERDGDGRIIALAFEPVVVERTGYMEIVAQDGKKTPVELLPPDKERELPLRLADGRDLVIDCLLFQKKIRARSLQTEPLEHGSKGREGRA